MVMATNAGFALTFVYAGMLIIGNRDSWVCCIVNILPSHHCHQILLSMMKLIVQCEVESNCAFLKSKVERRMMLKLRVEWWRFRLR